MTAQSKTVRFTMFALLYFTQGTILGLPLGASATVDSAGQAKPAAGGVQ